MRDDDDVQADYLACWAMEHAERRNNRLLLLWALQLRARAIVGGVCASRA